MKSQETLDQFSQLDSAQNDEEWLNFATSDPKRFIKEVENRFEIHGEYRKAIDLIKNGAKVDRQHVSKRHNKVKHSVGDWILEPYSQHLVNIILIAIKKGRLNSKC